jgi:hypothetical protein
VVNNAEKSNAADQGDARDDLRALARMIEYVSSEAKRHGLVLTAHLLDLAGWSLEEATADSAAQPQPPPELARPEKPN